MQLLSSMLEQLSLDVKQLHDERFANNEYIITLRAYYMYLINHGWIIERGQFGFRLDIKKLNGENVHSYVVFEKNAHTKLYVL